ncbi:hypothetical protein NBRC116590_32070 [Pelagimonas sp. KU-00592-HH]|uniref:hypothetical protein n=1 Tax=Pelagimonas sp. KU-00592-HH TaxID=3127651 RepID=UPI00310A88C5
MLRTIFSPDHLQYPIIVAEINVKEGEGIGKGDVVVRLHDRNGKMISVASPFEGTLTALDVQFGQQLFQRTKIAWIHTTEGVQAQETESKSAPATSLRRKSKRKETAAAQTEFDASKRYYVSAKGAWYLRVAAWLGFLSLFLMALVIIAANPWVLEFLGDGPVLVFSIASVGLLLAGLCGAGAGIELVEHVSTSAKMEADTRTAVAQRIRQGEDVTLPRGFTPPSILAVTVPMLAAYLITTDQIEVGNGRDRQSEQIAEISQEYSSTETRTQRTQHADFDVRQLLTENTGSARASEDLVVSVMGKPKDVCYRMGLLVRASKLDRKQCPDCAKTERQAQIDKINYVRDSYIIGQGKLNYINVLEFNLGYASTECQGANFLMPITKYMVFSDAISSVCDQGSPVVSRQIRSLESAFHDSKPHCKSLRPWAKDLLTIE